MNTPYPRLLAGAALSTLAFALLAACSKTPTPAEPSPPPSATVGAQVDDTVITSRVKSALLADDTVKGFDVGVETRNGIVELTGMVDNQTQIDKAVQLARAADGATSVKNELKIKP
jgi:hyperosmotically inducible protein